ncbi:hypothetical protein D3C85_1317230 [compost metagenome]
MRQAEPALDQCVIEDQVGQRAADADRHHRAGPADRGGEAAQRHEGHVAGQGEDQRGEKLHGAADVRRQLSEMQQRRLEVPQRHSGQ